MTILTVIDGILAMPVVRWLLLVTTAVAVAAALWCRGELGVVRLQRDAAKGQAAMYVSALDMQNASIREADQEAAAQQRQMALARENANRIKAEGEAWRKKAQQTPLTGSCDEMVDQVIEAVRSSEDAK